MIVEWVPSISSLSFIEFLSPYHKMIPIIVIKHSRILILKIFNSEKYLIRGYVTIGICSHHNSRILHMKIWKIITGHRIITLIILFLILTGLCIYYYDNFRDYQEHPGIATIVVSYPEGELVAVSGVVTETFPGGFYLEEEYEGKKVTFKILSELEVAPGDKSQVLGILGPGYQITAQEMKLTEKWSYEFLLLRSFIAFLFLAFIFHYYWRFSFKDKEFVRRR